MNGILAVDWVGIWSSLGTEIATYGKLYGINVLSAIAILVIGRWGSKLLARLAQASMKKAKTDPTLITFLDKLIYITLMAMVIISALVKLGVEPSGMLAAIGAAGLAVGLALQGGLSNFAAGMLIIFFRPFKVSDLIEVSGSLGVVRSIELFTTTIITLDNKTVIIPNSQLTSGKIVNFTETENLRMDLVFGASYSDDIDLVKATCLEVMKNDKRVLETPEPFAGVIEHASSSVNYAVRPWVDAKDYWDVYFAMHENIKKAFDEKGIHIPFPHQEVYLHNVEKETKEKQ
jgi:small conductance mechanosensitive channel